MTLTVHVPDHIAARLTLWGSDLPRRALEGFALEECRSGHITEPELLVLLGYESRYQLDGFLKTHRVYAEFTMGDFENDLADLLSAGF